MATIRKGMAGPQVSSMVVHCELYTEFEPQLLFNYQKSPSLHELKYTVKKVRSKNQTFVSVLDLV